MMVAVRVRVEESEGEGGIDSAGALFIPIHAPVR